MMETPGSASFAYTSRSLIRSSFGSTVPDTNPTASASRPFLNFRESAMWCRTLALIISKKEKDLTPYGVN
jgi:hypothetical protein